MLSDAHYRSIVKALSYRLVGSMFTIICSFVLTRNFKMSITIGVLDFFSKIILYYGHERLWEKIKIGRKS